MNKILARLLPVALLVGFVTGAGLDDDLIKDFKKYFRKYKDPAQRREAVLALDGIDSPAMVDVLVPVLEDPDPQVTQAVVRVLGSLEERAAIDHLLVELAEEKKEPRRIGLLRCIQEGAYEGKGEAVGACLEDRSWKVRHQAVQTLAAGGDDTLGPILLPFCEDPEVAVRCAAFDALGGLGVDGVRAPAVAALEDEAWQVRSSAITALGRVRHRDSLPVLIDRMAQEEGRLVADIGSALDAITGKELGTRLDSWQRFWASFGDSYQIPTDEELAELRKKQEERKLQYGAAKGDVAYHGIETPSRRVMFVIDISGSMENEVVERERFEDGDYPSYSRMDIVKTELQRTIENLEDYVEFNILAFATEVKPWKKKLVKANVLNKSNAIDWVGRLEPLGGASRQDLARVGLTGSANLEAGKTNTWSALSAALEIEDKNGKPVQRYELDLDTVFFLSDGKPTVGRYIDINEILRGVLTANVLRRVVIHAIAIGQFDKTFMRRLAQENSGVFVDLGK